MMPLEGIRVIDLTHVIAGPFATHQLRCMGAEVIKVERPQTGDPVRALGVRPELNGLTPNYVALNSGKKSVVLDLATEDGREALLSLVETAHVFVENFRPGVAKKLGLSATEVRKRRPDIVYCSISGWGQEGPMSQLRAYDHIVQAATGMMALQGDVPDAPPIKVGFPVIDVATGMTAVQAILAALLRRANGDTADIELDVSMADSSLLLMVGMVANAKATGHAPARVGNRGFVGSPGADTFKAADGYISLAANTFGQFRTLCAIIGRPDLAKPPYLPGHLGDNDFLADQATPQIRAELASAFAEAQAEDLERSLHAKGIPAAKVRNLSQYLTELYPKTRGIDAPDGSVLGAGYRTIGETPPSIGKAHVLGEDTAMFVHQPELE